MLLVILSGFMFISKKWALITGATSGIGLEFAKILAKTYNFILVGRNELKIIQTKKHMVTEEDFCQIIFKYSPYALI